MAKRYTFDQGKIVGEEYIPDPPSTPRVLDEAAWRDHAYAVLGALAQPNGVLEHNLLAGLTRYGAILKAARASDDDGVVGALDQYGALDKNFRKEKLALFLQVLASAGIVTPLEYAAIMSTWPTG